jgi:hypothetical protein
MNLMHGNDVCAIKNSSHIRQHTRSMSEQELDLGSSIQCYVMSFRKSENLG